MPAPELEKLVKLKQLLFKVTEQEQEPLVKVPAPELEKLVKVKEPLVKVTEKE